MARPKSKAELLNLSQENFDKLFAYIDQFGQAEQEREFPQGTLNRNIRDVLMHLHHWHEMMLTWYRLGMAGQKPDMPARGYTWATTPALNRWIQEQYLNIHLEEAKSKVLGSFQKIRKVILSHSDEELFEKKKYKWTGTTSLGAYLISATSSHYDWALKLIRKAKK